MGAETEILAELKRITERLTTIETRLSLVETASAATAKDVAAMKPLLDQTAKDVAAMRPVVAAMKPVVDEIARDVTYLKDNFLTEGEKQKLASAARRSRTALDSCSRRLLLP